LWWLGFTFAITSVIVYFEIAGADADQTARRHWPRVTATAAKDLQPGSHKLVLAYRHPVTDEAVTATVVVVNNSLLPAPGGSMVIAADPENPDHIVVPGDGDEIPSVLIGTFIIGGVVAAAAIARWWSVRKIEHLVSSPHPSFAMVGALSTSGILRRRVALALYPVDAHAGRAPVCTVPVLTTGGLPIDGPCFPVEVRGRPVPGGAVVARSDDVVLWPLRRPATRGSLPRPTVVADAPPRLSSTDRPAVVRAPSLWRVLNRPRGFMLIPAAIAIVAVPAVVWSHQREAAAIYDHGLAVRARVVAKIDSSHVSVAYRRAESDVDTLAVAPARARHRAIGRLYPAHVDASDSGRIRLDADRYNATEPLAWVAVFVLVVLLAVAPLIRWQRAARSLEKSGSWCWGRLTVAKHHGTVSAAAGTGWAVAARVDMSASPLTTAVWVAGSFDPGAPVLFAGPVAAVGPPSIFTTPRRCQRGWVRR
jgi:hypothetical protein